MLSFQQMVLRLVIAIILGALLGLEREMVGKEAGIRTGIIVASGACVFAIIGISLPYLVATSPEYLPDIIARNSGYLGIIANIVVGIGFLGAGIIIKTEERVKGLTTAATVWLIAAIGVLAGIGLIKFAVSSAIIMFVILYLFRNIDIYEHFRIKQ